MKKALVLGLTMATFGSAAAALPANAATPEQAKAFSERAAAYIEQVGEDKAFAELERGLKENESWLKWLKPDPMIDPLRDDPRFKEILRRLNLK